MISVFDANTSHMKYKQTGSVAMFWSLYGSKLSSFVGDQRPQIPTKLWCEINGYQGFDMNGVFTSHESFINGTKLMDVIYWLDVEWYHFIWYIN